MKRLLTVLVAAALSASAFAQVGIVAGVTSTATDIQSAVVQASDITQYHIGLMYRLRLGPLGIQPGLVYNIKGLRLSEINNINDLKANFKTGYFELPVQVQAGINLSGFRPYVFAEPFLGYAVTNDSDISSSVQEPKKSSGDWNNLRDRLEYGVGFGGGIDLFNTIQISLRYFWNMGPLYDEDHLNASLKSIAATVSQQKCSGIMASIAFFF